MPFVRTLLGTLAIAATATSLGACGSDDANNESGTSTPPPAVTPTNTTPTPAPTTTEADARGGATADAGTVVIDMKDLQFSPAAATVKVGDKVTWTNLDDVPHNVISSNGSIQSPNFGKGESFTWTADEAVTISYSCTLHPGMDGTLNVE